MPRAANGDWPYVLFDGFDDVLRRPRNEHATDGNRVELGNVVHEKRGGRLFDRRADHEPDCHDKRERQD